MVQPTGAPTFKSFALILVAAVVVLLAAAMVEFLVSAPHGRFQQVAGGISGGEGGCEDRCETSASCPQGMECVQGPEGCKICAETIVVPGVPDPLDILRWLASGAADLMTRMGIGGPAGGGGTTTTQPTARCGDGTCTLGTETAETCPEDCLIPCQGSSECPALGGWECISGKCQNRRCDTSRVMNDAQLLLLAMDNGKVTYDEPSTPPGSNPRQNKQDIANGMCPMTERHMPGGGNDGSSSGPARPADYLPYSTTPQMKIYQCAPVSLQGMLNLAKSDKFKQIRVSSEYGGNHDDPDHRDLSAEDITMVEFASGTPSGPAWINDLNDRGQFGTICNIVRIIKETAGPAEIIGPAGMAGRCTDDVIKADSSGGHNDHLHIRWNCGVDIP